jgi:hypothetical protein
MIISPLLRAAAGLQEDNQRRITAYAKRTGRDVASWFDGANYWFPAKRAVAADLADQICD